MILHAAFANDRSSRARKAWPASLPVGLCVGVLLALGVNDACADALGSLATSMGLFAALAALFVIKGWPAHLQASAFSTAGGALVIAGGAAWLWRARTAGRAVGLAGLAGVGRSARQAAVRPARVAPVTLPPGVDREALLAELRLIFVRLQEAWDAGSMPALQALTTAEMLAELRLGLPACTDGAAPGRTDVVTLRADLFGFEQVGDALLVSVEFSGLMREAPGEGAAPFRELWMLTKSKHGASGWKLARHQALL